MEKEDSLETSVVARLYRSELFFLIIFCLVPILLFALHIDEFYRLIYFIVLAFFICIYVLFGQFLFESLKLSEKGRILLILTFVNTVILSFVKFTGNTASPYFFLLYFLLFITAIIASPSIFFLEGGILFVSIMLNAIYSIPYTENFFQYLTYFEKMYLFSLLLGIPLGGGISAFINRLKQQQSLLALSKDLLMMQDIEGETLLSEIKQGIIVLDTNLRIVKISRWVEKHFEMIPRVLLGEHISKLTFFDAVSQQIIKPNDYFYQNLSHSSPQILNWRVLYKNQYGKLKKFVIKQLPLKADRKIIGFVLSVSHPPKTFQEVLSSFSQLYTFQLGSSIVRMQNLVQLSQRVMQDPLHSLLNKQIELVVQLLNDTTVRNTIADGRQEITIRDVELRSVLHKVIKQIDPIRNIAVWDTSIIYKDRPIKLETDAKLLNQLITYALKGTLYISRGTGVDLTIDEDDIYKKPMITISVETQAEFPQGIDLIEPFFGGKVMLLAKYAGTGLEISNANLIAKFLNFDFRASIKNHRLIINIIF